MFLRSKGITSFEEEQCRNKMFERNNKSLL